jgi:hypothetical protein
MDSFTRQLVALRTSIEKVDGIFQREVKRVLGDVLLEVSIKHHLEYSALATEYVTSRTYGLSQDVGQCQGVTNQRKRCGKPGVHEGYCELHLDQREVRDAKRRRDRLYMAKTVTATRPVIERNHLPIVSVKDCLIALGLER